MIGPAHDRFRDLYIERGDWIDGPAPDALARAARRTPDKAAIVDRHGSLTYRDLDGLVRRFACALLARGVGPGDRVAIQLPNWREFAIVQQAALRIAATYVPLLPQLREADISYALEASQSRVLVVPRMFKGFDHADMAANLGVENVFVVDGNFETALASPWEEEWGTALDAIAIDPDAPRVILFTSGTESRAKGVVHSYNTQYFGLKRHVRYFALDENDTVMCVSPVGHGTGAVNGVEFAFHLGGTVVMMEAWEPRAGLSIMHEHGATMMWGATTFYADLVTASEGGDTTLGHFRYAFTAGAPVPHQLPALIKQCLGATLIAAYGQSEGQNITITRPDDPLEKLLDTDGRFHDGIEWKLVDANRQPLAPGVAGEVAYRGPNVCLGYLDPVHTAKAFDEDGFIYSGDIGRVDDDGYLRIVGRSKEIIIRGGENISPAEIEEYLFDHPAVTRVAVVGYPDARLGERACAVVIPAAGAQPELQDLIDHMAARHVAKYKYPERLLLVESLPTTPSGKVRKDVLRQMLLEDSSSSGAQMPLENR